MKLKEFDLDLPNATGEERHAFRLQNRCMGALYARCFPGLGVVGGWKVLIECVERIARPDVRNLLGVFTSQVEFDRPAFLAAEPSDRKAMAIAALHSGAIRVAEASEWPRDPFDAAKDCVVKRSYINEWTWPKPKVSPDKRHEAFLQCSHEPDEFRAWLVVQDRRGAETNRKQAISESPSEFAFVPKMGSVAWITDELVALLDKKGHQVAATSATQFR